MKIDDKDMAVKVKTHIISSKLYREVLNLVIVSVADFFLTIKDARTVDAIA